MTGSYLKPPSVGGLWDGVTTMPSARPSPVKALGAVGGAVVGQDGLGTRPGSEVKSSRESMRTVTPLATSTSMAVFQAGSDRAWVSRPMYSGPVTPAFLRYSAMACVMATIGPR